MPTYNDPAYPGQNVTYTTNPGSGLVGSGGGSSGSSLPGVPPNFANYNPTGILNDYTSRYNELLNTQRQALEGAYKARVGQIKQAYIGQKQGIQDTGGRIAGSLRRTLGRAGAFTTTAGATAEANQQQSVQNQINSLTLAKEQALNEALAAKQSGEAQVYEAALNNMFNIQKEMTAIQQYEQARIDKEKEREYGLVEQGYQKIQGPSGLEGLTESDIARFGKDIYKRPSNVQTSFQDINGPQGYGTYLISYDPSGNITKTFVGGGKPSGSGSDAELNQFYKDIEAAKNNLMKGYEWGPEYDNLVSKYGPQTDIFDKLLGGSVAIDENGNEVYTGWAKPGAYQEFKKSLQSGAGQTFTIVPST